MLEYYWTKDIRIFQNELISHDPKYESAQLAQPAGVKLSFGSLFNVTTG
jgi:hypothetical protein